MQKRSIFKSKKSTQESVWTLIGLVFVGVAIIFLTYGTIKFGGLLLGPSETEKSTITNFDALAMKIKLILSGKDKFDVITNQPYSLGSLYMLVGFDKDSDQTAGREITGYSKSAVYFYKPSICSNKACICLLKNIAQTTEETKDSTAVKCHTFEENIIFASPYYTQDGIISALFQGIAKDIPYYTETLNEEEVLYGNLILRGEGSGKVFGSKNLYIEKFVSDADTYIFLSDIYNKDKLNERCNNIQSQLSIHGKC